MSFLLLLDLLQVFRIAFEVKELINYSMIGMTSFVVSRLLSTMVIISVLTYIFIPRIGVAYLEAPTRFPSSFPRAESVT
nr:hypothetical protein Iba_chr03bCG7230 [Ipomoea batatas]